MTDADPELDRLLRAHAARFDPGPAEVDHLLGRLLACLPPQPVRQPWPLRWGPFAVPMAAALLGLVVGQGLAPVPAAPVFAGLFDATLLSVMGW